MTSSTTLSDSQTVLLSLIQQEFGGRKQFHLTETYACQMHWHDVYSGRCDEVSRRAGVRADLQVLRDAGYIIFINNDGLYQWTQPMTNFDQLNEEFNQETDTSEVNENLCFNTALLEKIRSQEHLKIKFVNSIKGYATLVEPEVQLVDLRQIHGLEPIGTPNTSDYRPRGFQTRSDKDLNSKVVDELTYDIQCKDWDHTHQSGAVFLLPEKYQYVRDDGIKVIYGIGNLTHRYTAANKAVEEKIPAWIIDIPLHKLGKWANAEANYMRGSNNSRTNENIINQVILDMENPDTELYTKLKVAEAVKDGTGIKVEDILYTEVNDYHVHPRTANSIVSSILHKTDVVTPDRKRWKADQMVDHIAKNRKKWVKSTVKGYDYEFGNTFIILLNSEGDNILRATYKYVEHVTGEYADRQVIFVVGTDKATKLTKENRDVIRNNIKKKFFEIIAKYGIAAGIVDDGTARQPIWKWFPELNDEYDFVDYH
tara:strand:+ start:977 stop:2422 length:1446 start_codon:yes stop_codon:yes gene_type:complete